MIPLADQIEALLDLNAKGAVSHPVPGLAVELLTKAAQSLRAQGGVRVKDALRIAEKFSQEYEWDDGESGHHVPSEFERLMMLDMLNGLFADDAFLSTLEASPAPVSEEIVLVPRAELAKLVSEYEIEFDPEIINRPTWVKEALEAPAALAAKGGQ